MADLAFRVKAEYDEVIMMREELARLRGEIAKVDATTEDGQRKLAALEGQYERTFGALRDKIADAAKEAAELKQGVLAADDATVSLMNTIRDGESTIKGVFASINQQIESTKQGIEDSQKIIGSLLDELKGKLTDLLMHENDTAKLSGFAYLHDGEAIIRQIVAEISDETAAYMVDVLTTDKLAKKRKSDDGARDEHEWLQTILWENRWSIIYRGQVLSLR